MFNLINWFRSLFTKPEPVPIPPQETNSLEEIKNLLLTLHNNHRKTPLTRHESLDRSAQKHNDWMTENRQLSHNEPRRPLSVRINEQDYKWSMIGENIAEGQKDAYEVMESWMNSPGHRANIENKTFEHVGFGVSQDSKGTWWWTANFGKSQ